MNLARLFIRIDSRRPASWLAMVGGAAAAWFLAAAPAGPAAIVAAWSSGACLAVAAIGGPLPPPCGTLVAPLVWLSYRVAWPAIGAVIGMIAATVQPGGEPPAAAGNEAALAILAGMAAASNAVGAVRRRGGNAADAASLALFLAASGAMPTWLGTRHRSDDPLVILGLVVMAWGALAAAAVWIDRQRDLSVATTGLPATSGGDMMSGPLRRWLYRGGMAAALGGMIGWLFLNPDDAVLDVWLSVGCFVILAFPAALLADIHHDPAWRRLLFSAPTKIEAGWFRRLAWGTDPACAVPSTWMHAAVLGWPPLVAALLSAGDPQRAAMALGVTAAVLTTALFLRLLETAALRTQGGVETLFAVALIVVIATGLAVKVNEAAPRRGDGAGRAVGIGNLLPLSAPTS